MRSFAHTSKSNLSALRRYQYERPLDVIELLIVYIRSIEYNNNDTRSLFHPRCAFGQWNSIVIDCLLLQCLLDPWRSKRSNKPLVNFIDDYIQSREMMKLNSTSQSLRLKGPVSHSSLVTFKWLMKLFRIRPYELIWDYGWGPRGAASDRDLLVLRDTIPHWNEIQVLDTSIAMITSNPAELISPFPSSLTDLRLTYGLKDMSRVILPSSLKTFEFVCQREQSCDKWPQMPSTLETLILNGCAQSLKGYDLPSSLTHLQCITPAMILGECSLPSTLKVLRLVGHYNQPIQKLAELPNSLETLEFGGYYNHPVDQLRLSSSLQSLTFGRQFNHSIDRLILPQSLTQLCLGYDFNQPIRGDIFPPQLKSLTLGYRFNQPIRDWELPNSLTHIEFGHDFAEHISDLPADFWPTSLTRLIWHQFPLKWIPSTSMSNTPSLSDVSSSSSTMNGSHIYDSSHIATRVLKPIFDRTSHRRQRLSADGRNEVIEMLNNICQAELNESDKERQRSKSLN